MGLGTAIYTNGLLVGETLPVMLTVPSCFRWSTIPGAGARDLGHPAAGADRESLTVAPCAGARHGRDDCAHRRVRTWWPDWR